MAKSFDEAVAEIESMEARFSCRFHPTEGWHETGCPHQNWTVEQLQSALILQKKNNAFLIKKYVIGKETNS